MLSTTNNATSSLIHWGEVDAPIYNSNHEVNSCCLGGSDQRLRQENLEFILAAIRWAAELCDVPSPIVVSHLGNWQPIRTVINMEKVQSEIQYVKEDLMTINNYLQRNYPHIVLGVENRGGLSMENGVLCKAAYGMGFGAADIVQDLALSNVKSVLDICHAEITCRSLEFLPRSSLGPTVTMQEYINRYVPSLTLVHLSWIENLGVKHENHGMPFGADSDVLFSILRQLDKLGYEGAITIETREDDYNDAKNYIETASSIKRFSSQLGLSAKF